MTFIQWVLALGFYGAVLFVFLYLITESIDEHRSNPGEWDAIAALRDEDPAGDLEPSTQAERDDTLEEIWAR